MTLTLDGPDGHPIHREECSGCNSRKISRVECPVCDGTGLMRPDRCCCDLCEAEQIDLDREWHARLARTVAP